MLVIREGEPPVEMKTGDEPYEVFILSGFALWGVYGLLSLSRVATPTVQTIPTWGAYLFYASLAAGCLVSLLGIVYQVAWKKFLGFYIERAGLVVLVGLCTAYSVWAVAASGTRAIAFAIILSAIGGASLLRIFRIRKGLRAVVGGAP